MKIARVGDACRDTRPGRVTGEILRQHSQLPEQRIQRGEFLSLGGRVRLEAARVDGHRGRRAADGRHDDGQRADERRPRDWHRVRGRGAGRGGKSARLSPWTNRVADGTGETKMGKLDGKRLLADGK